MKLKLLITASLLFTTTTFSALKKSDSKAGVVKTDNKQDPIRSDSKSPNLKLESSVDPLYARFLKNYKDKNELNGLKQMALARGGKAIPSLVKAMKSKEVPDKNRWIATFLVGKIMGQKASPFLSKYTSHPNWVLRMASLKTLLALKEKRFGGIYEKMLTDKSLIVRSQAIENIRKLGLTQYAPQVWGMLYNKDNYQTDGTQKKFKRSNIIKSVITTVGDLKFAKAKAPLLKMINKKKYEDIFDEMNYALEAISGKSAPEGNLAVKRRFWSKYGVSTKVIN